ncbi:alpha/beta fold hydrolase [Nocardioides sp.]|uniref:alpha/beta fold hydrolase n=1 Tax=Nocardioides sp. TaxID=35761 RepID=UPI00273698F6|nr:alpha/beta hydrolase [Nocardioides sp.]MDP3890892.1 alpha/beta hydrolase [Nocardioides sp.]
MTGTSTTSTRFTVSADGTRIAYERTGSGPALVLVDGALCQRSMGPARGLARALEDHFTVHAYDRRGRGESDPGATAYAAEREVEDLNAVIDAAGGRAHVFGASSGAVLALEAARAGAPIDRLAVYEAPFIVDDTHTPNDPGLGEHVQHLVDSDRRSAAVKTFLRTVGMPGPMVALMPLFPVWRRMTAVAHTLPWDLALVLPHQQGDRLPEGHYARVAPETLVIAGGKSPAYLRNAQAAVADALPAGCLVTLPGQTHMIKAKVTGPVVARHLLGLG